MKLVQNKNLNYTLNKIKIDLILKAVKLNSCILSEFFNKYLV